MTPPRIKGFLKKPRHVAKGGLYKGRFTCHDVQWAGEMASFTATAAEIADAADSQLLWTDQDVQRGIKPGLLTKPPRELSVASGYPNPAEYVFDANNADDIAEKLLEGELLFLNPLVWNLRPSTFEAYSDDDASAIYLYSGKVYLPDSHHRHQAIVKAVRAWRDSPSSHPRFTADKQFKVELYFLEKENEGNYFFDKNQRPKPTSMSKAYDLTTLDDLSLLAKKTIEKSKALTDNVNRVTDRLSAKNPHVVTLSTLREMIKTFAPAESLDSAELEGLAAIAGQFFDLLARVRTELGVVDIGTRRTVRQQLISDSAVMMHGYAALMKEFGDELGRVGVKKASADWERRLERLAANRTFTFGSWSGDLFEKKNPLWQRTGIVKPGRDPKKLTVLNTGAARATAGRILRAIVIPDTPPSRLEPLVRL